MEGVEVGDTEVEHVGHVLENLVEKESVSGGRYEQPPPPPPKVGRGVEQQGIECKGIRTSAISHS